MIVQVYSIWWRQWWWKDVGHLILSGLVWKSNGQKESKRPWDLKPKSHMLYYKCISHGNKKCIECFIFHIFCAVHVCLTWYRSRLFFCGLLCACQSCTSTHNSVSELLIPERCLCHAFHSLPWHYALCPTECAIHLSVDAFFTWALMNA